jgi:hypothetical protein
MKTVRFASAMATGAALCLASTVGFGASSTKTVTPPRNATSPAPMPVTESPSIQTLASPVLLTTAFAASTSGAVVVGPGFQPVDALRTVVCPAENGPCRIEADQAMQVTGGPGGANRWAICTQVDGVFMDRPSCPFMGQINPGYFQSASFSQQRRALPGSHTVRTFIYSDYGATLGNYSIQYRVYQ